MARFRMPQMNSDLKAYFSHFRKGIFTILGIALIGGLIVASFIYGNNEQRQAEDQSQTAQSEDSQQSATDESEGETTTEGATGNEDEVPIDDGESGSSASTLPSGGR